MGKGLFEVVVWREGMSQALFLSLEELFVSCQTMSGFTLRVELREGSGQLAWLARLVRVLSDRVFEELGCCSSEVLLLGGSRE